MIQEEEPYVPPYMAPNPDYTEDWRIATLFAQAALTDVYGEV